MHLIFATSIVPDGSPATGYEIANDAIIGALRRAGAKVTVIGFTWPGKAPSDPDNTVVLGEVDVSTDSASALQKVQWLARATASGSTFSSVKLKGVPAAQVAQALADIGPVDGYVLNAVQFAGAFEDMFTDKPFIFVAHNVEHRSAQENAAAARSPLQRMLYRREARLLEALEARLCERARYVFTLAEEDRAMLGVAGDARSAALPLVTGAVPSRPADRAVECDAALVGTWTWQPNRIGLDWFLEQVVPRLAPSFRIRIAGRTPADVASSHPGVGFVGRVPDAVAFVRSAAVVPLIARAGTGVQLKTIETFELGLPAVATSSSLRGVDYFPQNCTVADEPEAFARALQHMAASRPADLDGTAFRNAQLLALDTRVRAGLDRLRPSGRKLAA